MVRATKRSRWKSVGLALAAIFPLTLSPMEVAARQALTWERALRQAIAHNEDLTAARAREESAHQLKNAAYGNYFPQVEGGIQYDYGKGSGSSVSFGGSGGGGSEARSSSAVSVGVSQNLFSGFSDYAQIKKGQANQAAARADLMLAKAQVSRDLKAAFSGLTYAQDFLTLSKAILKRRSENRDIVSLRFESGTENKGSQLQADSLVQAAELDVLQAKNTLQVARHDLGRVLGEEGFSGDVLGSPPLSQPIPPQDWAILAKQTPAVIKSGTQIEGARADVLAARSGFFPSVDAVASLDRFIEGSRSGREQSWSVGVAALLPVFNGGRDYHSTKGAKAAQRAAIADEKSSFQKTVTELNRAYAAFEEGVKRLKADAAASEAAAVRAEIARTRYNNGLSDFEDWDLIENDLINKQKALLQSRRDRVVYEADWELAQGKGVIP